MAWWQRGEQPEWTGGGVGRYRRFVRWNHAEIISKKPKIIKLRETYGKHLIGLVENEHLHRIGLEESTLDHIVDTTRSANNDLRTLLKSLHVVTNAGTTNACVALNVHEVTNSDDDLLNLLGQFTGRSEDQSLALLDVGIELLENRDGESCSFSGTWLCLGNNVVTFTVLDFDRDLRAYWNSPLMTGIMARCWIADGRSKP